MQIAACFRPWRYRATLKGWRGTAAGRVCFPLLVLTILTVLSAACGALTMKVTTGYGGVYKSGYWTPIAVKLANAGEDDIEGVLVVEQTDDNSPALPICTTQVSLPAHSNKLYHAYVRMQNFGGNLRVSLARGYGVLAFKEIEPQPSPTGDRIVLTIGERASRLSYLEGETIKALPPSPNQMQNYGPAGQQYAAQNGGQATLHAGSLLPTELPDRSAGLEQADVIIAQGLSPETVNPNALKAICAAVASGSTLVVSVGPDYKSYTNDFYKELLPVDIQGAASLPGMPSLGAYAKSASPIGPVAVAKSVLKAGADALVSESGMPIVAVRRYGAGVVVFLAFDIHASPFKDWNGQTNFWKQTIFKNSTHWPVAGTSLQFANDQGSGRYYNAPSDQYGLANVVMQNPSIRTPSLNTIGAFLLSYLVVLVPINYAFLKRRRRLELAWVTTPAIVLVFALGAYAIGYTMKGGDLKLSQVRLIEGSSGARFARSVTDAFVFSPARRSYDLAIADPTAISQVVPMSRDDRPVDTYLGEATVIKDVGIPMWSSKTFEAVGGEDLGGAIETHLTANPTEISGTVTNNTNADLRDCKVVLGREQSQAFDLPKGATRSVTVAISQQPPLSQPNYYDSNTDLRLRVLKYGDYQASQAGLSLVGYSKPAQDTFAMPNDRPSIETASCYIIHLDDPR